SRLHVGGDIRVGGAGNGLVFPDGTKQTSAAISAANAVQFVPGAEQLSVGDANGTAPMINLRGGSTCCSGPGGHTPAFFKVFQNGSFVATGNLGIGVSPMQGKGYRTSWDSYKGAFRSGYADNEWDDATVGFFSWAGGSNSTAEGLYALAFGDTNFARSTSSIAFGSGNEVKGAAGFSAGAGNRVCDTYGVAFGNNARSGGPYINGKCDPDTFNIRGLAAVAIGYNVTADQDHTTAMGKFATNNGFTGTFIWADGAAQQSADTFRNTANNEFAVRATGGVRLRTSMATNPGTGCNLPANSGVFNCTSSRTTKENFFAVDGNDVLSKLRRIPVSAWNYIGEAQGARHIGPMAEDFHAAFKLGSDDKTIGVQDAVGVSLAAVKALDERTSELQTKTDELQRKTAEVEQLRTQVHTLEQRLAAIEEAMKAKEQK
ncbi:MAG TPA: tail fiber domain-containing protein, partial [Pyrinomonadaceae bacterium]|nr:tail fiber domain-containing protein [Pyrinomonadaceae bacterium]